MRQRAHRSLFVRRSVAALTVPLALVLASCGSDADQPAAGEDTASVAGEQSEAPASESDGTDEKGSPSSAEEGEGDQPTAPAAVAGVKEGDRVTPADFAKLLDAAFAKATTAKVAMVNDSPQLATSSQGVIDLGGKSPRLQLTMTGGPLPEGTTADIRLLEDGMYMDTGFSGGKFVKVPADQIEATGIDLASIDPSKAARSFAEAATKVTYRGNDRVGSESLHRYTLELDPGQLKIAGGASKLPKKIDYDAWFDSDGMLRQVTTAMGQLGSTTVTYSDWGAPITIEAPAASDVMELPVLPSSPRG